MKIFTGTSGYGYKEWKGKFYPDKISADKMLTFYSSRLSAVEINNTFYRMPTVNVVEAWAQEVPKGFVFAVKAPQIITHVKRLRNVKEETKYFLTTISALGSKLGPVLFQFPSTFHENLPLLEDFLSFIPPKTTCAFLFRSKTWLHDRTYSLLSKKSFGLCFEDLRLRRAEYRQADLSQWAKAVLDQKWQKVFVFFKHEDDTAASGPRLAMSFSELANGSVPMREPIFQNSIGAAVT